MNKPGKKRKACALIIVLLSVSLGAMNWPAEDAILVRNFGSDNGGRPVLGMIFAGDSSILAAEKGEVIFSRGGNDTASRLPSPLGAWTAVDHGDGLISIYSRYDDNADMPLNLSHVERSQQIAAAGTSGWSQQSGFYFMIFDRRERRWINPAMIMTPVQRTGNPRIVSVDLVNEQGESTQMRNLTQGRYFVHVSALSPAVAGFSQGNFLAPQRIICLVNGSETGSLNFEAFSARDGVLMAYRNGLVPAKQVYSAAPAFEAAEIFLSRGQVTLEIIVQDIAGNVASSVTRMAVN